MVLENHGNHPCRGKAWICYHNCELTICVININERWVTRVALPARTIVTVWDRKVVAKQRILVHGRAPYVYSVLDRDWIRQWGIKRQVASNCWLAQRFKDEKHAAFKLAWITCGDALNSERIGLNGLRLVVTVKPVKAISGLQMATIWIYGAHLLQNCEGYLLWCGIDSQDESYSSSTVQCDSELGCWLLRLTTWSSAKVIHRSCVSPQENLCSFRPSSLNSMIIDLSTKIQFNDN